MLMLFGAAWQYLALLSYSDMKRLQGSMDRHCVFTLA